MQVLPVINCPDSESVRGRIHIAQSFLCDHGSSSRSGESEAWIHIDVADGGFTNGYETWRNPDDLHTIERDPHLKIEVHLMINDPEFALESWLNAGVNRIIVHLQTTTAIDTVANLCRDRGVEVWLALAPEVGVEKVLPYLPLVQGCQILAVHQGLAGQAMLPGMIEKVKALRAAAPLLPIEVDGGITTETIKQCAKAGASQVVAGSAIFDASDPAAAYRALLAAI